MTKTLAKSIDTTFEIGKEIDASKKVATSMKETQREANLLNSARLILVW